MSSKISDQVKNVVEIIYTPDKNNFEQEFMKLLDILDGEIEDSTEMQKILLDIQEAYMKKDYVQLADILLYKLNSKV